jgi:8-oxo-dGTP pyrophosphatase MutT (NUDIX family)
MARTLTLLPVTAPPDLADRPHHGPPVEPRPASSVLVVDHRARPWTLLMIRRPGGADFAPSAYVFPGGSLHEEDAAFDDPGRAAAVRELFEEVGILQARRHDGSFARQAECDRLRAALAAGTPFPRAMADTGLVPAFDRLALLTRWITPEALRRRFDARFYLARLPAGQAIHPQPGEVEDVIWISPARALQADGPTLVHATRRILESVAEEPNPARLIARVRRRRREPTPIMPVVEPLPDGSGFRILES